MNFYSSDFEFDKIGDGTDVSLNNTEINDIQWTIFMRYDYKPGFLSSLLSVLFPESLRRLVFGFFVFYLFKSI